MHLTFYALDPLLNPVSKAMLFATEALDQSGVNYRVIQEHGENKIMVEPGICLQPTRNLWKYKGQSHTGNAVDLVEWWKKNN